MNKNYNFFLRLLSVCIVLGISGFFVQSKELITLPSMFFQLIAYYFVISSLAFFINIKGTQKESEIGVWYYMAAIMTNLLLAAASVVILTKFFPDQKKIIVFTNFVLFPFFEVVIIQDIYKRIRS